jgi:hypothetical protein
VYRPDALEIADYAAQSPQNLFRVGLFVISTINQRFEAVPAIMAQYERYGIGVRRYTGLQKRAIKTLAASQGRLFDQMASWKTRGKSQAAYAIRDLVEYPGFGIIKAAFFAQLVLPHADVGCLDRHNLRMYGLAPNAFSRMPTGVLGLTRKINVYLAVCRNLGGSEVLWNNWVMYLAALRPQSFASGEVVSRLHVTCIIT